MPALKQQLSPRRPRRHLIPTSTQMILLKTLPMWKPRGARTFQHVCGILHVILSGFQKPKQRCILPSQRLRQTKPHHVLAMASKCTGSYSHGDRARSHRNRDSCLQSLTRRAIVEMKQKNVGFRSKMNTFLDSRPSKGLGRPTCIVFGTVNPRFPSSACAQHIGHCRNKGDDIS